MPTNQILFVGSVPLADAAAVFRALGGSVGAAAARLPDGETGIRQNWIRWQDRIFAENPCFTQVDPGRKLAGYKDTLARPFFEVAPGVDASQVSFGELGYAREAIRSFAIFKELRAAGEIPPGTRFQVSIPTALDILTGFVALASRATAEPALEAALRREIIEMAAHIPLTDLAIQWDAAMEVTGYDGGHDLHLTDILTESVERIARQIGFVPEPAEVGVHLCYGDPGHKHVIEPRDLGTCVTFANAICATAPRPVDWIHMPVPRDRDDAAYFEPLAQLRHTPRTKLFLGLVHFTDGIEGTARRIAAAKNYLVDFGIATECGFGRRDPATIPALLDIHNEALSLI